MALLEVKNLSISFGGLKAVDNSTLRSKKDSCTVLSVQTVLEKLPFSTFLQVYISQMQEALS